MSLKTKNSKLKLNNLGKIGDESVFYQIKNSVVFLSTSVCQ